MILGFSMHPVLDASRESWTIILSSNMVEFVLVFGHQTSMWIRALHTNIHLNLEFIMARVRARQ